MTRLNHFFEINFFPFSYLFHFYLFQSGRYRIADCIISLSPSQVLLTLYSKPKNHIKYIVVLSSFAVLNLLTTFSTNFLFLKLFTHFSGISLNIIPAMLPHTAATVSVSSPKFTAFKIASSKF